MYITCVHQGYELYGSDRSFVESVRAIRAAFPAAEIEVVLPRFGAIGALLHDHASRITVEPLWILRRRNLRSLMTFGMVRLPIAILRAWRRIRRSDLVYINTTVVADYILASRLCPEQMHHSRARDPRRNGALGSTPDAALERCGHHLQLARHGERLRASGPASGASDLQRRRRPGTPSTLHLPG